MRPDWAAYWVTYTRRILRRLGIRGALAYLLKDRLIRTGAVVLGARRLPATYRLYSRESATPLICRYGTTDRLVFRQVFIKGSYDDLWPAAPPRLVIDGGANVGHSTAYLLTRFPEAQVIAVEADDRNFEVLEQNLAPYGDRATAINAAIWSRGGTLALSRGTYLDGREWSTQVVEASASELPTVAGIDVGTLLQATGMERIDVLKLDVEGAEVPIFRHSEDWIDRVDLIAVELHDDECRATFHGALPAGTFETFDTGDELTIARRLPQDR